jgi:hypothetical protein
VRCAALHTELVRDRLLDRIFGLVLSQRVLL